MFGRGLVHPPDLHHAENPPSNPELLRVLGDCFVRMNFDIRQFLREIALSSAYQRSFDPPANLLETAGRAASEMAQLEQRRAELEKASQATSAAYEELAQAWESSEAAWLPVAGELDTARNQYGEAKKKVDEAMKAVADATAQLQAKKSAADPLQQAATATQAAIKALPDDKELADAAQKFVARAQKLSEEAAVLTKTVDERTAAVGPMEEAWNKSKPPVETARVKVQPLQESLVTTERAMRAARTKAMAEAETLAALDRRLAIVRSTARLPELNRALIVASEVLPRREAELAAAQKHVDEFAPLVADAEAKAKLVGDTVASAASVLKLADERQTHQVEAAQSVAAALSAVEVARQKLPDDAVLADSAAKLQSRTTVHQVAAQELQKQVAGLESVHKSAQESFVATQESLAAVLAERSRRQQAVESAKQAMSAAQAECTAKRSELDSTLADLADRWSRDFTLASLKPLTPEQLCWTVFRVTGVYDRYWQTEVAELDKAKPLTDEQKKDPAQLAARDVELEQRTYDKLKGNIGTFVSLYGAAAGQPQGDFFSTADQALFVANGGAINSWVAPAGDNVAERIVKLSDPRVAAEELYLGVLTRFPTEDELAQVVKYLSARGADKGAAAQELVWGLLNSAEFRFNH
jgi:chromosome segregation ATPase